MMRKVIACVSILVMCFTMIGCNANTTKELLPGNQGESEEPKEPEEVVEESGIIRVGALNGPTAMGLAKMIQDSMDRVENENEYTYSDVSTVDEMVTDVVQGSVDIAAVPANLASVLYNKTDKNITVLAINTLGVLYICEKGDSIQSVADLKGKTIYASGKGATPEYALNYILKQNGLDPEKDVTIEWKSEHAECVAAIETDKAGIAMLPQPFVTTAQLKDSDIRVALDLTDEWDAAQANEDSPSALVMGVTIVNNDFLEKYPKAVAKFMEDYKKSIEFVNENPDIAAVTIGLIGITEEAVAKVAIPECNITYIDGAEMKEKLGGYLETLAEQSIDAVGGTLPDEEFYYQLP